MSFVGDLPDIVETYLNYVQSVGKVLQAQGNESNFSEGHREGQKRGGAGEKLA